MGNPRHVRPDEVEILVTRELRKAGIDVASLRRGSIVASGADYTLFLAGTIMRAGERCSLLVEFRNQETPVSLEELETFAHGAHDSVEEDAPKRLVPPDGGGRPAPLRVMVSTSGFVVDAARHASALGITLLAIADGAAAFRRSQWSMGEQTPAWVPEYMAERVVIARDGTMQRELIAGTAATQRPQR